MTGNICCLNIHDDGGRKMPTYEYQCQACKHEFALIQSFREHEKGKVTCPKCKGKKVKQVISIFTAKTSRKS
jgi:putative FmdB family regulatory protein